MSDNANVPEWLRVQSQELGKKTGQAALEGLKFSGLLGVKSAEALARGGGSILKAAIKAATKKS